MPPKKKSAQSRKKTKTIQKAETHTHLSVAQKVGVAIALLAGFSAIAAGFAAIPRRSSERPPREDRPAYNERREQRGSEQEQKSTSSAQTLAPGVSISAPYNAQQGWLISGQEDVMVLDAQLFAIADDVLVKELTFRVSSLSAAPIDGMADAFTSFKLQSNETPWGDTVAFADNGFITFSEINQTIEKGKSVNIQLKADVLDAINLDSKIFGQPFAFVLETGITPPVMVGAGSEADAIIEGEAQSQAFVLSRALISQSFSEDAGKVSPEGFASKSNEQVIAIIKVSNTSPNGYEAHLADFRLKKMAQGISGEGLMRVYKDAISSGNLLGEYEASWDDSQFMLDDVSFDDVIIAPGASRYLYVTLNTANPSISANDAFCMRISPYATWTDGTKLFTQFPLQNEGNKCLTY